MNNTQKITEIKEQYQRAGIEILEITENEIFGVIIKTPNSEGCYKYHYIFYHNNYVWETNDNQTIKELLLEETEHFLKILDKPSDYKFRYSPLGL